MSEYTTPDSAGSIPFAFECPTCDHFPLRVNRVKKDLLFCPRCNRDMVLVESLFSGLRAVWENSRGKLVDMPLTAFERVQGKSRARGRKVF